MIAKIEIKTQHGEDNDKATSGIGIIHALDQITDTVYAHSSEDAISWVMSFPLYAGALVEKFDNGSAIIESVWQLRDTTFDAIFDENSSDGKYTRSRVHITVLNTIYENAGYQGGNGRS